MATPYEVVWKDEFTAEIRSGGRPLGWFCIQPSFEVHEHEQFWKPKSGLLLRLRGLARQILPVVAFARRRGIGTERWDVEEIESHFPAALGGPIIADLTVRLALHRKVLQEVERRGFRDDTPTFRLRKFMTPEAVAQWRATAER